MPPDLFTSNRPLTDQEREQVRKCIAAHGTRMRALVGRKSALKLRGRAQNLAGADEIHRTKAALDAVVKEQRTIREVLAFLRRASFASFRSLPEDIIKEILLAALATEPSPSLTSTLHAPLVLTHICSGMRRIALTTPALWTSIRIVLDLDFQKTDDSGAARRRQWTAACASAWINERSGGMPLALALEERGRYDPELHAAFLDGIMDLILGCAARWRAVRFQCFSISLLRIAALRAADVPLLRSVDMYGVKALQLESSALLRAPTITQLRLIDLDPLLFPSWARLTRVEIRYSLPPLLGGARGGVVVRLAGLLEHAVGLVYCSIAGCSLYDPGVRGMQPGKIRLAHLKALVLRDTGSYHSDSGHHSDDPSSHLLNLIAAPNLEELEMGCDFTDSSNSTLHAFLQRSPKISTLRLVEGLHPDSFLDTLRHLPALEHLQFTTSGKSDLYTLEECNALLQALSPDEDGNDESSQCLCPKLRTLICTDGGLEVSIDVLRRFLTQPTGNFDGPCRWEAVSMEVKPFRRADRVALNVLCDEPMFDRNLTLWKVKSPKGRTLKICFGKDS